MYCESPLISHAGRRCPERERSPVKLRRLNKTFVLKPKQMLTEPEPEQNMETTRRTKRPNKTIDELHKPNKAPEPNRRISPRKTVEHVFFGERSPSKTAEQNTSHVCPATTKHRTKQEKKPNKTKKPEHSPERSQSRTPNIPNTEQPFANARTMFWTSAAAGKLYLSPSCQCLIVTQNFIQSSVAYE